MKNIINQIHGLTSIGKDFKESITKEYFDENYGYRQIPVVFKKGFQNLKIRNQITLDFLFKEFSQREKLANLYKDNKELVLNLKDYIDYDSSEYYYTSNRVHKSKIKLDNTLENVFPCWYSSSRISKPKTNLLWLYVGLKNTFSCTHIDIWSTSAWNYLVEGTKLWFVYPKHYSDFIAKNIDSFNIMNQEGFNTQLFELNQKPLVYIQKPGELIFIPSNTYHAVLNIDMTVSLTGNFFNQINYDDVRSFFRKKNDKNNSIFIENIIKDGFKNVKKMNYEEKS